MAVDGTESFVHVLQGTLLGRIQADSPRGITFFESPLPVVAMKPFVHSLFQKEKGLLPFLKGNKRMAFMANIG